MLRNASVYTPEGIALDTVWLPTCFAFLTQMQTRTTSHT